MNSQGKTVTYKGKKVDFSQPSKQKRTEAITAKGQKATGVSGKNPNIAAVGKGIKAQQRSQRTLNALEKVAGAVTEGALMAGAGGVAGRAAKTAVTAARGSYALGKRVVHGSPVQGLKKIEPRLGSAARPKENVAYGWNPKAFQNKQNIVNYAGEYARGGSYYVGKVPRSGIVKNENKGVVVSKAPIKVKKEIRATSPDAGRQIDKALPGSKIRAGKTVIRKKGAAIRRQSRDKSSPV